MIGYLQSMDRVQDRLRIGPSESSVTEVTESELKGLPMLGSFSTIRDRRILFYRWSGELRLRVADTPPISLAGAHADWNCDGAMAAFVLKQGERLIWSETYAPNPEIHRLGSDPTPFSEAEDFDILLFISNVLHEPERSSRIYRTD